MLDPPDVPRPGADGPSELADRVRALRSDARVGAVVLACVALAAGVAWFRAGISPSVPGPAAASAASSSTTSSFAFATAATGPATTTSAVVPSAIVVDVVGAVRSPGVVSLTGDARVIDAIRAAGGSVANADLARLNLAAKLTDGARVAVPRFGEPPPVLDPSAVIGAGSGVGSGSPDGSAGAPASGPTNVNTATLDQLETLPGIGPTLAGAIVQERERNGPFHTVDDLNRVPGIGDGRLSQLRDLVTVG